MPICIDADKYWCQYIWCWYILIDDTVGCRYVLMPISIDVDTFDADTYWLAIRLDANMYWCRYILMPIHIDPIRFDPIHFKHAPYRFYIYHSTHWLVLQCLQNITGDANLKNLQISELVWRMLSKWFGPKNLIDYQNWIY